MKTFKQMVSEGKRDSIDIPLKDIHREGGIDLEQYKDTDKVNKMRKSLKSNKKLKPVEVTRMTPKLRKEQGASKDKKWFMVDGNHRYAAHHFEGKTHINATNYYVGEKLK